MGARSYILVLKLFGGESLLQIPIPLLSFHPVLMMVGWRSQEVDTQQSENSGECEKRSARPLI